MHQFHPSERDRFHFTATVSGFPRHGPHHELPTAVMAYRNDEDNAAETLSATVRKLCLREERLAIQGGLDSVPVGTFSFHDRMLDAAVLYGALPARVDHIDDHVPASPEDQLPAWIDRYLTAAHGGPGTDPLATGMWFGTELNYSIPELDPQRKFSPHPDYLVQQLEESRRHHTPRRATLIGPATFLALSLTTDGTEPLERINELVDVQCQVLTYIAATGTRWVQIDEPIVNETDVDQAVGSINNGKITQAWSRLVDHAHAVGLKVLAQTYFGDPNRFVQIIAHTGVDALGLDLVNAPAPRLTEVPAGTLIVAGLVDGHSALRTELDSAFHQITELSHQFPVAVSTSCSLVHAPYLSTFDRALADDPARRIELALERAKISEVTALAHQIHHPAHDRRFSSVRRAFRESRRAHGVGKQ